MSAVEYHHCEVCAAKTQHKLRFVCLEHGLEHDASLLPDDELWAYCKRFPGQAAYEKDADYLVRVHEWLREISGRTPEDPTP